MLRMSTRMHALRNSGANCRFNSNVISRFDDIEWTV